VVDLTNADLGPQPEKLVEVSERTGLNIVLIGPFLVPMTIEADPSRRTAMQSGATQLLAGALGPLLASFIVSDADVFGAVYLGTGLILSGLAMMGALHLVGMRERRLQAAR